MGSGLWVVVYACDYLYNNLCTVGLNIIAVENVGGCMTVMYLLIYSTSTEAVCVCPMYH